MLSDHISKIIVLSLPEDSDRRSYIKRHFSEIGLLNFIFFEATSAKSKVVQEYYERGRVKVFPGCFRCQKDECNCANNILIPQQVANWVSFIEIWKSIAGKEGLFLICEDDVAFHKNAPHLLNQFIQKLDPLGKPLLIRLAESGKEPDRTLDIETPLTATNEVKMSNAAYIMNGEMAAFALKEFEKISTTSDIWLHHDVAKNYDVMAITVEPLIGTELSYNKNFAKFHSRIHPKGIDENDSLNEKDHVKRVNSKTEYESTIKEWWD